MSHRFESGIVGRQPAWHGLGVVTQDAVSAQEAITLAGLDWRVEPRDLQLEGTNIAVPGWKANVRDRDGAIVGVTRASYVVHQPQDAFDFTDALLDSGARFDTAGSLAGGSVIWVSALLPPERIIGAEVAPYLFFTTSYDYSVPSMAAITPTQIVCWNTLSYAIAGARRTWVTKHTSSLAGKVQEAQATLGLAGEFMGRFREDARRLHELQLSRAAVQRLVESLWPIEEDATSRRRTGQAFFREQFWTAFAQPDLDSYNAYGQATGWTVMQAAADMTSHWKPLRRVEGFEERRFEQVLKGPELLRQVRERLEEEVAA